MTLEHIPNVHEWMSNIIKRSPGKYYFQVPNTDHILSQASFVDFYYEHCSYFTKNSLLFLGKRLGVIYQQVTPTYSNQYLIWEFEINQDYNTDSCSQNTLTQKTKDRNIKPLSENIDLWKKRVKILSKSKNIGIWGGGSKAVAFIHFTEARDEIGYVFDINPLKHNTFLPGSGHRVVLPSKEVIENIDAVILMNPIYKVEVQHQIATLTSKEIELIPFHE